MQITFYANNQLTVNFNDSIADIHSGFAACPANSRNSRFKESKID